MTDFNAQIIDEFRANEGRVGGPFERARVLEGDEREPIWTKQNESVPVFADYEQRAAGIREIPVILLERA